MDVVEALALVAGHVEEEVLLRNEYLAAENEILRSKLSGRVPLTDSERIRLAKLGKQLGLKALKDIAAIVKDLGEALYGSFYPQAATGDALHDLAARRQGISVCELLGGRCRDQIRVGLAILTSGEFGSILPAAEEAVGQGYRHLRLKIGGGLK